MTKFYLSEGLILSFETVILELRPYLLGDQLWASGTQLPMPEMGPPSGLEFLEEKSEENQYESEGRVTRFRDFCDQIWWNLFKIWSIF